MVNTVTLLHDNRLPVSGAVPVAVSDDDDDDDEDIIDVPLGDLDVLLLHLFLVLLPGHPQPLPHGVLLLVPVPGEDIHHEY